MWTVFLIAGLLAASNAKVKEYDGVLSDEEHFGDEEGEGEHNSQYDHEAFLGKDEAKKFDDLSPDESKDKLGDIHGKIDNDSNGQVSLDELKKWMAKAQHRYAETDAKDNMENYDKDDDKKITFDEYKKGAYGFLKESGELKDVFNPDEYPKFQKDHADNEYYAKSIAKDERRYKAADKNGDSSLDADELAGFLHPETKEDMRHINAIETIEEMDKDGDNQISLDEFLADLSPDDIDANKSGDTPEWIQEEKKNFTEVHDTNKDGKLDAEEVKRWIFPAEEDYLDDEAQHLLKEADANNDGQLSKDEMLEKYDVFVGSQATDFGEMLRDEL